VEDDFNGFGDIVVRDRGSPQAGLFCGSEAPDRTARLELGEHREGVRQLRQHARSVVEDFGFGGGSRPTRS
jgi:hypothetical protein